MTDKIEITERQRERIEQIKQESTEGGRLPEYDDQQAIKALLDTHDLSQQRAMRLEGLMDDLNELVDKWYRGEGRAYSAAQGLCADELQELIDEYD